MPIINRVSEMQDEISGWRRELHQIPELNFDVVKTASFVETRLQEFGVDEIVTLLSARGPELARVAEVADNLRRDAVGDVVTFVRNRNINYTNICTFKCRFCAFSKGPLSLNLRGDPYLLDHYEIQRRVVEAVECGAT